jgi:hypothetical protein
LIGNPKIATYKPFRKGQSGNPGGRPKIRHPYREKTRGEIVAMSNSMIDTFWKIMKMKNLIHHPKQMSLAIKIFQQIGDSIGWFAPHNPLLMQFNMGVTPDGKDPNAALLQANLEPGGIKQLLSVADIMAAATAGANLADDNPTVETTGEVVEFRDPEDAPPLQSNGHSNGGIHPSTITRR